MIFFILRNNLKTNLLLKHKKTYVFPLPIAKKIHYEKSTFNLDKFNH